MIDWIVEWFAEFEDYLGILVILVVFFVLGVLSRYLPGHKGSYDEDIESVLFNKTDKSECVVDQWNKDGDRMQAEAISMTIDGTTANADQFRTHREE